MKLESGLNRIKENYLFAHLTYCILTVTYLLERLKDSGADLTNSSFHYLWIACMLVILALIPAQHKIITKTFYRDRHHLNLYKAIYAIVICLLYIPIVTSVYTGHNPNIILIVPVILNSIICGTIYGLATSLVVFATITLTHSGSSWPSVHILTECLMTMAILVTTAWFIGQSFEYIKNLLYQLLENDQSQKKIMDHLGMATLHVDSAGWVVHANQGFRNLFGEQVEKETHLDQIILVHLPFLKPLAGGGKNLLAHGDPVFGQAVDSRGRQVPVQCIICPISTDTKENKGLILCINDISLSERLEEEKIRTNSIIDFVHAGVILADASGKIIEMNQQALSLLQLNKEIWLNESLMSLMRQLAGQEVKDGTRSPLDQHYSYEIDRDGHWLLINFADLRNHQGQILGMTAIISDITEQREIEKKMQRSATLLAIGELAAGTAHEIRNPLTSIRGFLQLMQEKRESPIKDFDSYFEIILGEVDRISTITSEFLKLAKPEKVELEPLNLNQTIDSIWELLSSEAMMQDIKLRRLGDQDVPTIMGNVDLLKQVVINLVSNALQANKPGGTIKVSTFRHHRGVLLRVEDNGKGIDDSIIQRIFDPFFTTRSEGTGLGLAITNKILGDHNASVQVHSKPGQGTTFEIIFPRAE